MYDVQISEIPQGYAGNIDITAKFEPEEEPVQQNSNTLYYILIAIGGIAVFFGSIIVVVVFQSNKRKVQDQKRISSLIEQINDVVNKRK